MSIQAANLSINLYIGQLINLIEANAKNKTNSKKIPVVEVRDKSNSNVLFNITTKTNLEGISFHIADPNVDPKNTALIDKNSVIKIANEIDKFEDGCLLVIIKKQANNLEYKVIPSINSIMKYLSKGNKSEQYNNIVNENYNNLENLDILEKLVLEQLAFEDNDKYNLVNTNDAQNDEKQTNKDIHTLNDITKEIEKEKNTKQQEKPQSDNNIEKQTTQNKEDNQNKQDTIIEDNVDKQTLKQKIKQKIENIFENRTYIKYVAIMTMAVASGLPLLLYITQYIIDTIKAPSNKELADQMLYTQTIASDLIAKNVSMDEKIKLIESKLDAHIQQSVTDTKTDGIITHASPTLKNFFTEWFDIFNSIGDAIFGSASAFGDVFGVVIGALALVGVTALVSRAFINLFRYMFGMKKEQHEYITNQYYKTVYENTQGGKNKYGLIGAISLIGLIMYSAFSKSVSVVSSILSKIFVGIYNKIFGNKTEALNPKMILTMLTNFVKNIGTLLPKSIGQIVLSIIAVIKGGFIKIANLIKSSVNANTKSVTVNDYKFMFITGKLATGVKPV